MNGERWQSRFGFIMAAAGSAVGLANIWKFPYIVGTYGGAAFIIVYLICLLLIGIPVFMSEILIGRSTHCSPSQAFAKLTEGKASSRAWGWAGKATILTGFIVSSFYSAVAAWVLGYLFESIAGHVTNFHSGDQAAVYFDELRSNPFWSVGFHFLFVLASVGVLISGVRGGIERGNKIMMPIFIAVLLFLVIKGLTMPHAGEALKFLLHPDWKALTPAAIITALGHSFFTLSIGQGTMVTYGSYMTRKENLITSCLPVVIMDTGVSILAAVAVFTIAFSVGIEPDSGTGLVFHTLPLVFSQISGGYVIACFFFLLVTLAALTSEISAMEPLIAYLVGERGWKRRNAVIACGLGAFAVGVPCALSFGLLKDYTFFGSTVFEAMNFVATNIMILMGGLFAVVLVGWVWGYENAIKALKQGSSGFFDKKSWILTYFWFCFKYSAPILIILVFLHALGLFQ